MDTLMLFPITHIFLYPALSNKLQTIWISLFQINGKEKYSTLDFSILIFLTPLGVCAWACMWVSFPSMINGTILFFLEKFRSPSDFFTPKFGGGF